MRVWSTVPLKYEPTAHALVEEVAATALRIPSFGLAWTFHPDPFQCRISPRSTTCPLTTSWDPPTPHPLVPDVAASDPSAAPTPSSGARVRWSFHGALSPCSMRALSTVVPSRPATAQADGGRGAGS